jgi:DNA-binding GntR family transcriptional regulator
MLIGEEHMSDATTRGSGSQFAYSEVKRRILNLDFKPGTRLFEESLAASLGVSRTPLREALRQLESESLLERQPAGGLVVPVLDGVEIANLYDVRAALESLMATGAARVATAEDGQALEGIVARHAALIDFPDEAIRFGTALHSAIADLADNSWAVRLHGQVASQMERYRQFTNHSETRRRTALAEHGQLVAAVAANDSALAGKLAFDHVIGARDEALRAIGGGIRTA